MSEPARHRCLEKDIFFEALEMATAEERAVYLDQACAEDLRLRRRVEDLLAKHFQEDSFMKEPALESAPTLVVSPSEGPNSLVGRYKLLEKLGEGGFGMVYVAEQREPVKRRVALKIIKLGMDTKQVIARFEAERQALALMDHPNIAKVLDAGATETGRPYFVMELVRGMAITKYCDEARLPTVERLKLLISVCHAIQHAHQKGIIHRDIKPSNILVTLHDGVPVPKVIDFGIAKATQGELTDKTLYTQFQQFIGTPAYISPEQAEMSGLDLDTRSDIYSLGVLLYELLTSKTPLDGEELMRSGLDELRRTIREEDPPRPSTRLSGLARVEAVSVAKHHAATPDKLATLIRGDLDWIVMKCLEKDRTRRYDTASGLAADINRYLNNEPVVARPPSTNYRLQKFVRRHKGAVAAVSGIVLALCLGLTIATFAFVRERQARLAVTAADKAKRAETIRADAVGTFVGQLLTSIAPELLQQGHQRSVRELLLSADHLASTALSNAPAAELQVRGLISTLYLGEGPSLLDPEASYEQVKRITQLLPLVPDEKLPMPRDVFRITMAASSLWARQSDRELGELEALRDEFRRRTPPSKDYEAWCLAIEGNWQFWKGESAPAEAKLTEAMHLQSPDSPPTFAYFVRAYLALALTDRGALVEAEQIIREVLVPPEKVTPDLGNAHSGLVSVLASVLCRQNRFAEARTLLLDQKQALASGQISPRDLLALDKKLGEVLARAGNAAEALPIFMSVATNSLGTVRDCVEASCVALGSGDTGSYRQLCNIGLLRFTAGAEGIAALSLSEMFLAGPQDKLIVQVVEELLQRAEQARDFSKGSLTGVREWLLYRKGDMAEAATLLPKVSELPLPTTPILARVRKADYLGAVLAFRTSMALCQLGKAEEAAKAYSDGVKKLGRAPSEESQRDLGDGYIHWYLAEAHRREADQLFQNSGIALP